jgi:hypothetical protein
MSADKNTPSNRLVTVLDNGDLTPEDYASVNNAIDTLRTQAAKIEALTQELADAKQAARYETDVAAQAIADFNSIKLEVEALKNELYYSSLAATAEAHEVDRINEELIDRINEELKTLRKDDGWQPIEAAPRDVMILIFQPPSRITFSINDGFEYKLATHWKPLPQPPAIKGEQA